MCLTVAKCDRTGFIEHQDIYVACRLDRAAAHGQHVCLVEPAHARNADCGEQRADRGGGKTYEQGHQSGDGGRVCDPGLLGGEDGVGIQRDRDQNKDDGECHEEDLQRDLIRRFLARRAFHHGDHLIEEAFARFACNLHDDPIRQNRCAASDCAAVAAAFADNRRGLAGDGALICGSGAFDHFAVRRDLLAGLHDDDVALFQRNGRDNGDLVLLSCAGDFMRVNILFCSAQGVRLRFAASLRNGLCEVCKQHGKPEDHCDGERVSGGSVLDPEQGYDPQSGG